MIDSELKLFLDSNAARYECVQFIKDDPISIPHRFSKKEDIEIAGFFAAILAWGNRKAILKSCALLMDMLDNSPHDFILNAQNSDLKNLESFYYRTFNGLDTIAFVNSLRNIYNSGGMESCFLPNSEEEPLISRMKRFRNLMLKDMPERTKKHIADMAGGSAAKRLNLFLRWMVRPSFKGVDFGLWQAVSSSELYLPLDVHSSRIARKLGLLTRKQNDRRAVEEITAKLKSFCPQDPVKYDFALFGAGVTEK